MKLWQRRALGTLTLGGGAIGVIAATTFVASRSNPIEWLFCALFSAYYIWGIWCGMRLLEGHEGAERTVLTHWLFQIPTFGSPLAGYFLSSGFHVTIALQVAPTKLNGSFHLGSTFTYSLLDYGYPWLVGVNVFAAGIAIWLVRHLRRPAPNNGLNLTPQSGAN